MSHETIAPQPDLVDRMKSLVQAERAKRDEAYRDFVARYPAYEQTAALDELRSREYHRLDETEQVYLDYTGGGLYSNEQLAQHMQMLASGVFGNPHSSNPTSLASTDLDENARAYVLQYFNADPDEYAVIFTANATGALRLLGEAYPFADNGQYLLTFDNHNSVNGIREFARRANAPTRYAPLVAPELRIDADVLRELLQTAIPDGNNLFAFPAQSNFSGVKHSLDWIEEAHAHGWDVLCDCAAYAPTNRLDLSAVKPDFVSLSFYKMFGYPTGVGALIARKEKLAKLKRPWFAGGTVTAVSVRADRHVLETSVAAFEDGTIDYLNLPAVEIGLKHLESVGIETIHDRVTALTGYLLDELSQLTHDNGQPLVKVYGPTTTESRGGTVAFNLTDSEGHLIDYRAVEALANSINISLRTGCFCNPGADESAKGRTEAQMESAFAALEKEAITTNDSSLTSADFMVVLSNTTHDESVGAVRVSLGLVSNFDDVHAFLALARSFLNL